MLTQFSDIQSPFAALRNQLKDIPPGAEPIDFTIGAPRHPAPSWAQKKLDEAIATIGNYPAIQGTKEFQSAILNWAESRFQSLNGHLDNTHCLPLNGSREGLFYAVFMAKARRTDIENPIVLLPNPYYQVYGAAALAAGAEPYFLNATEANGFLPDITSIPEEISSRTIAFYLCTPSNPEGAIADASYLENAVIYARTHNMMLFSDECYSEIYSDTKPHSALELALKHYQECQQNPSAPQPSSPFSNVCSFNSLSKRSNVPGIRSGIILGDPEFMASFANFRNVAAPQIPGPIQHLSTHLWQDETHVAENRARYVKKFELAENILKNHISMKKPQGGFFLWLNMSDFGGGIEAVSTLWKGCGLKLLPGAYLAQPDQNGINPGEDYVRMALVGSLDETEQALRRLVRVLG